MTTGKPQRSSDHLFKQYLTISIFVGLLELRWLPLRASRDNFILPQDDLAAFLILYHVEVQLNFGRFMLPIHNEDVMCCYFETIKEAIPPSEKETFFRSKSVARYLRRQQKQPGSLYREIEQKSRIISLAIGKLTR